MNFKQVNKIFLVAVLTTFIFIGIPIKAEDVDNSVKKEKIEYKKLEETSVFNSKYYDVTKQEDLLRFAQEESEKIEIIINGFSRDIKSLAQTLGLKELLSQVKTEGVLTNTETEKKYYPKDKEKYWKDIQEYFLRFYEQNPDEIDMVRLFYKNGYVVNGVVRGEEDINDYKGDKSWFKDVMNPLVVKNNEVYISPISIARRTNSPAVRYVMPIDVDGERLGLVIINFKASTIYSVISNEVNLLFLDKAYENAEGDKETDRVITLSDTRNPSLILNESRDDVSIITADQLAGDNGFFEFTENGKEFVGAYQIINVPGKQWYVVNFINSNELIKNKTFLQDTKETLEVDYIKYIYWFISGLVIIFLIFALLCYLKIIKLERVTLLIALSFIFILISGMFVFGSYSTVGELKDHFKKSYIDQHLQLQDLLSKKIIDSISDLNIELRYLAKNERCKDFNEISCSNLLKDFYERNKEYVYASYRINKDGIIVNMYPVDNLSLNADISEQAHMKKIKKTLSPVLSDIFNVVEGFQGVTLHYPVIKDGKYDGTVAFLINIDNFFDILSPFATHIHEHESFLMDSHGQIIISDVKRFVGKNILEIEKYKSIKNVYKKILKTKESNFEEFVLNGEKEIVTYMPVKIEGNKWIMAVNGLEKDVYQGLDNTLKGIWIFTLLALISFVIFGGSFSYFLIKSLQKEVEAKTNKIKKSSNLIKKQLKKEELIAEERIKLLNEQKQARQVLKEKIEEMEKFQKLTVDRELKMIELKKEINKLKK